MGFVREFSLLVSVLFWNLVALSFGFDFDLRMLDLDNLVFLVFSCLYFDGLRLLCMFKVGWVSWDFCNLRIFLSAGCLGCVSVCLRFVVLFGFGSLLVFGWWVSYLLFGF